MELCIYLECFRHFVSDTTARRVSVLTTMILPHFFDYLAGMLWETDRDKPAWRSYHHNNAIFYGSNKVFVFVEVVAASFFQAKAWQTREEIHLWRPSGGICGFSATNTIANQIMAKTFFANTTRLLLCVQFRRTNHWSNPIPIYPMGLSLLSDDLIDVSQTIVKQ